MNPDDTDVDTDADLDVTVQTGLYAAEMFASNLAVNHLLNIIVIGGFVCMSRLVGLLPKLFQTTYCGSGIMIGKGSFNAQASISFKISHDLWCCCSHYNGSIFTIGAETKTSSQYKSRGNNVTNSKSRT
jgi:hypothetical protein